MKCLASLSFFFFLVRKIHIPKISPSLYSPYLKPSIWEFDILFYFHFYFLGGLWQFRNDERCQEIPRVRFVSMSTLYKPSNDSSLKPLLESTQNKWINLDPFLVSHFLLHAQLVRSPVEFKTKRKKNKLLMILFNRLNNACVSFYFFNPHLYIIS